RGFHLALKNNRLEMMMAHNAPYNAIIEYGSELPREQWIQLTLRYDGSSKAKGLQVYLDGKEMTTSIDQDHLYKDIVFYERKEQPGLQIGARWRGVGIKGAVVDDVELFDRQLSELEILALYDAAAVQALLNKPVSGLSPNEKRLWQEWLTAERVNQSPARSALHRLRRQQNTTADTIQEVMVMAEMENPRQTYLLERGAYNAPGKPVESNTPAAVLSMPTALNPDRLGLSRWLMHPNHPLTARVIVNRYWQQLFGRGLVHTTEDFGNQGALPTHPLLLDWLAVTFRESGWDVKALLKKIVMSATYRQSSIANAELLEADVDNLWLARGPSNRLSAEMLRDNAL
ncbi:MAG: DUF1553 domain-containing protein, partial [Bacteroidota bacterium]